jgi:hypothetical protein
MYASSGGTNSDPTERASLRLRTLSTSTDFIKPAQHKPIIWNYFLHCLLN